MNWQLVECSVSIATNVKRLCDVAVLDGTNAQYTAEAQ